MPVVMSAITQDPTKFGLARSLARPAGNFTGFWLEGDEALMAKRLELLKDAVPGTARVGVLVNPDDPTDSAGLKLLPTTARALNLEVRVLEVRSADQLESVLTAAARDGLQALCVSQSPLFNEARTPVAALAVRLRLPTVFGFREFAVAGGLISSLLADRAVCHPCRLATPARSGFLGRRHRHPSVIHCICQRESSPGCIWKSP